jgi:hypothetical protein
MIVREGAMAKKRWYAVKSLLRVEAFGDPVGADDDYDPEGTLIEERVVLIRARSFEDALRRGEKEADAYAAGAHVNPYGQVVRFRRLSIVEAAFVFPLDEKTPEVWSSTSVIPASVTDAELAVMRFGPSEGEDATRRRRKYWNAELAWRSRS